MRVLGIDPGTSVTGYGVVDRTGARRGQLVECGIIRTHDRRGLPGRLVEIYGGIQDLIERHAPDTLALEGVFYGKNVRSALTLGQAHGVVLLLAEQSGLEIALYAPAVVKKTVVGNGRAAKRQVAQMVAQLLALQQAPSPTDAADGVAIALTHIMRQR